MAGLNPSLTHPAIIRLRAMLEVSAVLRFLLCGGTAAAINWLARIALSLFLPFEVSILLAYGLGMFVGFLLYLHLVWPSGESRPGKQVGWKAQVPAFLLVNAVGAGIVLGASLGLVQAGSALFGPSATIDALAHGSAIAIGALANYLGHSRITFASRLAD